MAGHMPDDYEMAGLAVPESINELHDLLERVAADHPHLDPGDLMMFETAVIEVAGNVVEHGRPKGKVVYRFTLGVRPDRIVAHMREASDAIPQFSQDSADQLDESGRGLALSRAVLDEMSYRRADGENIWTLVRNLA